MTRSHCGSNAPPALRATVAASAAQRNPAEANVVEKSANSSGGSPAAGAAFANELSSASKTSTAAPTFPPSSTGSSAPTRPPNARGSRRVSGDRQPRLRKAARDPVGAHPEARGILGVRRALDRIDRHVGAKPFRDRGHGARFLEKLRKYRRAHGASVSSRDR